MLNYFWFANSNNLTMQQFNNEYKSYLEKNRFCERLLREPVNANTNCIIVIPCYNEPDILKTLASLWQCEKTNSVVEIIVVINSGEKETNEIIDFNTKTEIEIKNWLGIARHQNDSEKLRGYIVSIKNLPQKHAGVGLARKIGMDEAADRFNQIKNENGIIVCLDADCTVEKNYLLEIERHFSQNEKATGCSIYFEHPLQGNDFEEKNYEAIVNYELFLRYYKLSVTYTGFPYFFHTIGSSMAVRNHVYQKQGGMNRRKAGEDFYFLHKIFPLGNFAELNSTCVIPSPRKSMRVPFGTGSAVTKYLEQDSEEYLTYSFQSFIDLKILFSSVEKMFNGNKRTDEWLNSFSIAIKTFLIQNNFENKLSEFYQHSTTPKMFAKRFYNWFDGFMILKFVHFARDNFYPNNKITIEVERLLYEINRPFVSNNKKEMLLNLRQIERETKPENLFKFAQ